MSSQQAAPEAAWYPGVSAPPPDISRPDIRLVGRRLLSARLIWLAIAALGVAVFAVKMMSVANWYLRPSEATLISLQSLGVHPSLVAGYVVAVETASAVVFFAVAVALVRSGAGQVTALLAAVVFVGYGARGATSSLVAQAGPHWVLAESALEFLARTALTVLVYVFPDGRFVPRVTRWMAGIWVLIWTPWVLPSTVPIAAANWPPLLSLFIQLLFLLSVVWAQVHRYRWASSSKQREQTRWVVFGGVGSLALTVLIQLPALVLPELQAPGAARVAYILFMNGAWNLATMLAPLTVGIAILRHRLYDIDIIINRTLVYGLLTALMAGLFSAVISLSQKLFALATGQTSLPATVLATLVVVSLFTPVKSRLQEAVDKRFKGAPASVKRVQQLGEQVRLRLAPVDDHQIVRRLLDLAVAGLEAEGGMAYLEYGAQSKLVHIAGSWQGAAQLEAPLVTDGKRLGAIFLGPRRGQRRYSRQEQDALTRVAEIIAEALEQDREGMD